MAVKDKALRRLAEKLEAAQIPFAVGGEWRDCQLGKRETWHELLVIVALEDMEKAGKVLSRLGMRGEQPDSYHFDGTEVWLRAARTQPFQASPVTVLGHEIYVSGEDA